VYTAQDFDAMFADGGRTAAYLAAIRGAVQPGAVVVEIGTGVGYFAVAACAAGARRVYAIEVNPVIELGAQVAADNGCADRITFIRGDSRHVTLPERGDVLLSDLRGVLPLFGDHIPTIADARARLVVPGATLIPRRDTLWAAPCSAPEGWRRDHIAIGNAPHGIDRRSVAARIRSEWYQCRAAEADLKATPAEWGALEYATIESPTVAGRAAWKFAHDAEVDGLVLWFEGDLGFGATISNSPLRDRRLYGQAFFPLERSLAVREGDGLAVELRAAHVSGEYVWSWNSTLQPATAGSDAVVFRQTNLASRVVAIDQLRRLARGASEDDRTFSIIPYTG
jgi:protein arginine N-methyltransferase 1